MTIVEKETRRPAARRRSLAERVGVFNARIKHHRDAISRLQSKRDRMLSEKAERAQAVLKEIEGSGTKLVAEE